jgi:hypothetical protein
MRRYTLIHADGSKERDLTAEDVVETVNKRYRIGLTVADILMIEPCSRQRLTRRAGNSS